MFNKELTDNEIIKALRECANNGYNENCGSCKNCPYLEMAYLPEECMTMLAKDALDLINRQKAEIERLQSVVDSFTDIGKMYSEIKAEAYKEFAERLKEKGKSSLGNQFVISWIDNLLKEMVGEDNGK